MASMATNGIMLPTNPMTAMAMGFEDQSRNMSSMAMAPRREYGGKRDMVRSQRSKK
jgi:hypothetical protein